jgi:glycosyltransferase involved in cell wall biosynthesis
MSSRRPVSFVLPCYNGKELMSKYLSSVLNIMDPVIDELIIVDDASVDGSPDFIRGFFPSARLIQMARNSGFSACAMRGVRESKNAYVCLLNTDLELMSGFLEPLLTHFDSPDVFSVSSMQLPPADVIPDYALPALEIRFGVLYYRYQRLRALLKETVEICWAQDAATVYDRDKLLALGGLELIYTPAYWEDVDISYRAWKRGWRSLYEPRSLHYHRHQKNTMSRIFSRFYIRCFHWKNRFLVAWRNFDTPVFWLEQTIFLPFTLFIFPLLGKPEFTLGFFMALRQIPDVLRRRLRDTGRPVISDRQILDRFSCKAVRDCVPVPSINVLYLHETSRISGAENSLLNLVNNLNKGRFTPFFVLPGPGPLAEELAKSGIEVSIIELPKIRNIRGVFHAVKELIGVVEKNNILIIHSNSIRTHMYGVIAAMRCGIHGVWHQRNLLQGEIVDPDRALFFLADRIICNSRAIARRFEFFGRLPGKVRVVFNGVDSDTFNPSVDGSAVRREFGIGPGEIVVGIASRFNAHKGHEVFLKAARHIISGKEAVKDKIRFMIIGGAVFDQDKGREVYLRDISEKMGLKAKTVFTGFRTDMERVYAAVDILVLASDAEPCGRVVLEAMSSGKPVIGTSSGGTPEAIEHGVSGYLFKAGDHLDLAAKIISLANDPDKAGRMGRAARQSVERSFKIESNVAKIEAIYREMIPERIFNKDKAKK